MMLTFDPVELAQRFIQIPSVTPDTGENLTLIEHHLSHLGFDCHRESFSQGGSYVVPNLYARIGKESPNFCFAGHTDVVPSGDINAWEHPPFGGIIKNKHLYGRGAADMKGAIAAFICAVRHFLETYPLKGSISFLITGDEEAEAINGTEKALRWIATKGEKLEACLVGEATCEEKLGDTIKVGRRGSLSGILSVLGQQGHVAYPHRARNPIPLMIKIINALYNHKLDNGNSYFQPSNFEVTSLETGNLATNVIPALVKAFFNIRYTPQQTLEDLMEWVEKTCQDYTSNYALEWTNKGRPFYTEEGPLRHLLTDAVQQITSLTPKTSTSGGTSDGRYIHLYCPVVEFGVINATIHKVNECVAVEDLHMLKEIYLRTLSLFFAQK